MPALAAGWLAQARAASVASSAARLLALSKGLSVDRGALSFDVPVSATASSGPQARLGAREATWHVARGSLAADAAFACIGLRGCEAQLDQFVRNARARAQISRQSSLAVGAGFQVPAATNLARAKASTGSAALTQQRSRCALLVKALAALTAVEEGDLRRELVDTNARLPQLQAPCVAEVPAEALAQRPVTVVAVEEVGAASTDAEQIQALRWPRITLSGSIGSARQRMDGVSTNGTKWSIGPVAVNPPLFDAGARRCHGVRVLLPGYDGSFRGGLASLFEFEDTSQNTVAARSAHIEQQREVAAWVETYWAISGGWTPSSEISTRLLSEVFANPHQT